MPVRAGSHNLDTVAAVGCSLNTVTTVRVDLKACEEEVESVTCWKRHKERSGVVSWPYFVNKLQNWLLGDLGQGIQFLAQENNRWSD